jgi:tRNA threonylcarbamoyladenosine biosynthesis protein TsaB
MPSLQELIRDYTPLLILDAASTRIQLGQCAADGGSRWTAETGEAGTAIFRCIETLGVDVDAIRAFGFCEGPGSILGVRTVAMAIRVWTTLRPRPVFGYGSLDLVARSLGSSAVKIIADARRDSWHCQVLDQPLRRVGVAELQGELVTPQYFRAWSPPPIGTSFVDYDVKSMMEQTAAAPLFRRTAEPDAFLHEEPSYATWQPHIHRAPSA